MGLQPSGSRFTEMEVVLMAGKEYEVLGLHCENCAQDLMRRYQAFFEAHDIKFDPRRRYIIIPDHADWGQLNKITSFEKIMFLPVAHDHADASEHSAGHGHHHDHDMHDQSIAKIRFVFGINLFFAIFEIIFGVLFNSAAILTDAIHDFGDAISIGLAGLLQKVSKKEANQQFSFGYERFSLLGGLITASVLLGGSTFAVINAIPRLFNPQPVNYTGMFWVAIVAIGANVISVWIMQGGKSINEAMLSLHLLEDVLGWVAILIVSICLFFTDWYFLDPLLSIGIALFIFLHAWPIFRQTLRIFLEGVPAELDSDAIRQQIGAINGVQAISHFHLWSIDGRNHALAITIAVTDVQSVNIEQLKAAIRQVIFPLHITHVTIETVVDAQHILK